MTQDKDKALKVVGSAAAALPALRIGAVQTLYSCSHGHHNEYKIVPKVLAMLLGPTDTPLHWDVWGNYSAARPYLGDLHLRADPMKTRHVLMMFEITRLGGTEMAELIQAGGPVGIFHLTASMSYNSAWAVDDNDNSKPVCQEMAQLRGQIIVPEGRWEFVCRAPRLGLENWKLHELVWLPLGESEADRQKVVALDKIPVAFTETSSRGYYGD